VRYLLFLLTAPSLGVWLTGCGADLQPSEHVSAVYLSVSTAEWEDARSIMLVGENGMSHLATETNENCSSLDPPPCPNSANVEIRSSAPEVISVARQSVRSPGYAAVVANGPGTATLTATADGITKSRRIDVVSAPLPLDAIRVSLEHGTDLPFQNDSLGSLGAVEVPVGQPVYVDLTALRDERVVYGINFQISWGEPGIVSVTQCVGLSTCEVQGGMQVESVSLGDAEITVSARGVTTGFTLHVVEAR